MTIATTLRAIVFAAALACTTHSVMGQVTANLPGSIVQSATLSGSARQQINDYVESLSSAIQSDDFSAASRAREQLIKPLADRDVSVAFRQAYTQSVANLTSELQASGEFDDLIIALRLAGELGTSESVSLIRTHMSSDDPAIRVFAIGRAQRVFEITAAHGPAIAANEASALVNAVASQADSEDDMLMIESVVRALVAGSTLPTNDLSPARNLAIQKIASIVSPILQELEPTSSTESAYRLSLRAASALTASITDISAKITPESTKAAVGLAGDILSVPMRQIFASRSLDADERALTVRTVQSAEALLFFARRKHPGASSVEQTAFAEMLRSNEDRDYRNGVSSLLGANSAIVRNFAFRTDRFVF